MGQVVQSRVVSAARFCGETLVESTLPPRLNSSKTRPDTGGLRSWTNSIVLSVASGNTIETLSELLPADSSITGPAFTFQLVLLLGPRENTAGRDRPSVALSRALSLQASRVSSETKILPATPRRPAMN